MSGEIKINYHSEPCKAKIAKEWKDAEFLGIFQNAGTDLLGHPFSKAIAVIRIDNRLDTVGLSDIKFKEVCECAGIPLKVIGNVYENTDLLEDV